MFAAYSRPQAEPQASGTTETTTTSIDATTKYSPSSPGDSKIGHGSLHGLSARSCITCRRRKVKCDKTLPCSNCSKASVQCIFPPPGRAPRRPRQGAKPSSEREAELLKRLRRLEGVVEELSGQVELEAVKHSPSSDLSSGQKDGDSNSSKNHKPSEVRVVGMDEGTASKRVWLSRMFQLGNGPPKSEFGVEQAHQGMASLFLEEGKSTYVSSQFWSQISDEVTQIRESLVDADFDSDSEVEPALPSSTITDTSHQSFVMGYSSSDVNLAPLHPLPSQIPFYWQTFLENVNPLVNLIHAPTMNKVIKEVQHNLSSLSSSTEALMFSIYFATVTSMNIDEVRNSLGVEKDTLLRQYRFGIEQALARAGFLNTNEIVTLQAFALFLMCVRRHDDTRFVWSLTGLLTRMAISLGVHRDGTKFHLSPFDTEMRRRLWWLICILDLRASEDHGSEPGIHDYAFDTQFPLNINDEDLIPEATEFPTPREGVSEMTFSLIRYEICSVLRKLTYMPHGRPPFEKKEMTMEEKEKLIRETGERLETQYLVHCKDGGPICWVAATVARLILAKMTLIVYHPLIQGTKHDKLSQSTRDRLLMASIEILEYSRFLESETTTKKWGWLFQTYIQWHAIAFTLGELGIRPPSMIVDRAWRAIDEIFDDWAVAVRHSKSGRFWQPMQKLMARARRTRQENLRSGQTGGLGISAVDFLPPPERNRLPPTIHEAMARDRQLSSGNCDAEEPAAQPMFANSSSSQPLQTEFLPSRYPNPDPSQTSDSFLPQLSGIESLTPGLLDYQFHQTQQDGTAPAWIMDENAFLGMDMNTLDEDVNWENWQDLVRDIQMDGEGSQGMDAAGPGARGPTLGGMGAMGNFW